MNLLLRHQDAQPLLVCHQASGIGKQRLHRLAQAAVANGSGTYFSTDKPLNFLGFPLVELPWFNANTLVATHSNNLFFGTDLLADFNTLQIVDMRATTADQKVRYRANFSADVNYGFGREVVLYRPA